MIEEAFSEYAKKKSDEFKKKRKPGVRALTVGASEIGQCARKICYAKNDQPKEAGAPNSWGANVRGTVFERHFWYEALRAKFGRALLHAGPKQKTFTSGPLSATPDGLVTKIPRTALRPYGVKDAGSDCVLVECKTVDPRAQLREAREQNKFQVQVQLGLVREETVHKPEYALITYTNASLWDDVTVYAEKFNPKIYAHAKTRAAEILTKDPMHLKPEGWIAGGAECEWCPYARACGVARRRVPDREGGDVDPQFAAEITDMCRDAEAAAVRARRASSELLELHQGIKDRLRERGVRRIANVVVWSAVKARLYYDYVKLRAAAASAGVDVEKFSTVGEPTDRLQIFVAPAARHERGLENGEESKQPAARKSSSEEDPAADAGEEPR